MHSATRLVASVSAFALASAMALSISVPPVFSAEGMWLPQEIPDDVMAEMRAGGLNLDRGEIWNAGGTGLVSAVVQVGATGSFVSPEGLILTNHHVAFGAVQRISSAEDNYIERGFLAKSRAEEVPALGYIAYSMLTSEDVTPQVLAAVTDRMTPLERHNAIEDATKRIIQEQESEASREGRDIDCRVSEFSAGTRYILYSFLKLRDVRVVYVPARAIGEYGGEIDNWMWPRHAGDFSFLRAYVGPDGRPADFSKDNVPFKPTHYLRINPAGIEDGEFALILGFPGRTYRYLTSYSLKDYADFEYPERVRLNKEIAGVLEEQGAADPAAAVAVAGHLKGINNYLKKYTGALEGFRSAHLIEREEAKEAALPQQEARPVLESFEALYAGRAATASKDLLLEYATDEGLLGEAMILYKWSIEKEKPDLERDPDYMDREIPDIKRDLRIFNTGYNAGADRAVLKLFLKEATDLPEGERIEAFDETFGLAHPATGLGPPKNLDAVLDGLYSGTRLDQDSVRLAMFDMSNETLMRQGDSMLDLASKLYRENEDRITREKIFSESLDQLRARWLAILAEASKGKYLYPDANGTLRLNYGVVRGYSPRDAVRYEPFTTLAGVVEKDTGIPPFNCPERIIALEQGKRYGPYIDRNLGDVPVDLLTTNDSTNGNSGSPLINSRGELVGCLFDGNYEALSCDFAFDEDLHRSICVDARYILWVADYVDDAQDLLKELGVK